MSPSKTQNSPACCFRHHHGLKAWLGSCRLRKIPRFLDFGAGAAQGAAPGARRCWGSGDAAAGQSGVQGSQEISCNILCFYVTSCLGLLGSGSGTCFDSWCTGGKLRQRTRVGHGGAVAELETQHAASPSSRTPRGSHGCAVRVLLSPQGALSLLPPLIIKISGFEVYSRGFLFLR